MRSGHRGTLVSLVALTLVLAAAPAACAGLLYDNASSLGSLAAPYGIVTHPGGGAGEADLCAVTAPDDTSSDMANTGFGDRLADDFTVPAGFRWNITGGRTGGQPLSGTALVPAGTGSSRWPQGVA
jgi:hypothetical protein